MSVKIYNMWSEADPRYDRVSACRGEIEISFTVNDPAELARLAALDAPLTPDELRTSRMYAEHASRDADAAMVRAREAEHVECETRTALRRAAR